MLTRLVLRVQRRTFGLMEMQEHNVVARSGVKAEYRAMVVTTCELIWKKQLLMELGTTQSQPMKLSCNN